MTASASAIYEFGEFRLDPAARELRRGDRLLKLAPLTFDCLVLLVENRDRAVSREELIAAVWDKPYVEEAQVNQRIMQVRRVIGDDSQEPLFIRTVSGFGYRWIAETEVLPVAASRSPVATTVILGPGFRRWRLLVPAALVVALAAVVVIYAFIQRNHAKPLPRDPGEAVVVLPLDVRAHEGSDAGWIRLGAMDLIAERLRESGLPVPSSDSVVAALHAVEARPERQRLTALRDTLGAGLLVQGDASQTSDGWKVELTAIAAEGDRRRVESDATEVLGSARRAADLLLAALGERVASAENGNEALDELLQRAKAAILALELETARTILTGAPESLRDEPELRLQLAWVKYRAGRGDEAEAITTKLLDDPTVTARPRLHAEILMLRGLTEGREQEDWVGGERHFDAAVAALDGQPWAPELATALTMRGAVHISRHDFDAGAQDLGRARTLFEVGGDRLGLARVNNFFGNLELVRKRPADALPRFRAALEISESFGHVSWTRANLYGLLTAQGQLLRWHEALATSERLWDLRERVQDPVRRHGLQVARATVFTALGRHREAGVILAELRQSEADGTPHAARRSERARAELAWQQGRPVRAMRGAARMLAWWSASRSPTDELPTEAILLHQRASIAAGEPHAAPHTLLEALSAVESRETGAGPRVTEPQDESAAGNDPAFLVARAEWAAHQGDPDEAERWFRGAIARAEDAAVPGTLVLVADAYARWLLTRDRVPEALALAGRVAGWAERDYQSALLQVAVLHAAGRREAWATALRRARKLAGEREIPAELLSPPP